MWVSSHTGIVGNERADKFLIRIIPRESCITPIVYDNNH